MLFVRERLSIAVRYSPLVKSTHMEGVMLTPIVYFQSNPKVWDFFRWGDNSFPTPSQTMHPRQSNTNK